MHSLHNCMWIIDYLFESTSTSKVVDRSRLLLKYFQACTAFTFSNMVDSCKIPTVHALELVHKSTQHCYWEPSLNTFLSLSCLEWLQVALGLGSWGFHRLSCPLSHLLTQQTPIYGQVSPTIYCYVALWLDSKIYFWIRLSVAAFTTVFGLSYYETCSQLDPRFLSLYQASGATLNTSLSLWP